MMSIWDIESGKSLSSGKTTVHVTVHFEQDPTHSRVFPNVKLWARLPLADIRQAVAVECDRTRVDVRFVGTKQEIEAWWAKRFDPDFGLYFDVDLMAKPGAWQQVSLTEFKTDPSLIPPTVTLSLPDPTKGASATVHYWLTPVK